MISLSDKQLEIIMDAAALLPVESASVCKGLCVK